MGYGRMRRGGTTGVSASELATMGACERRVVLEHRHGRRVSAAQQDAIRRGSRLHAAFDAQAGAGQVGAGSRCFIATHVFGSRAPQTEALRRYRDGVLRASGPGRLLILWYYRGAPHVCTWLARHPWACAPVRACLCLLVGYARWRCRWTGSGHGR